MKGDSREVARPTLNLEQLQTLPVPVAPLPEQQEIVRRVEGLFTLADQLEARLAKARGQVEKLTPSLLARAFAGQLVPQDPTDEPAQKLLERIKATDNPAPPRSSPPKKNSRMMHSPATNADTSCVNPSKPAAGRQHGKESADV